MAVVAGLGHGPEVGPLEPEVRALSDADDVVHHTGENPLILALVYVALAVGVQRKELDAQSFPIPVIATLGGATSSVIRFTLAYLWRAISCRPKGGGYRGHKNSYAMDHGPVSAPCPMHGREGCAGRARSQGCYT